VPVKKTKTLQDSNDNVRVKTLAEIREERRLRFQDTSEKPVESETKPKAIALKRRLDISASVPEPAKKINLRKQSVEKKSDIDFSPDTNNDGDDCKNEDKKDINEEVDVEDLDLLLAAEEEEFGSADVKEDDLLLDIDNLINS